MILIILPKFNQTSKACRIEFEKIFKAYKDDKMANNISNDNCYKSKFCDAINE
jgi:hypothetical protein